LTEEEQKWDQVIKPSELESSTTLKMISSLCPTDFGWKDFGWKN